MKVEDQIAIIYCGSQGLLNNVAVEKIKECEADFIRLMNKDFKDTLSLLKQGQLTDEVKKSIETALDQVLKNYN